MSIKKANPNKPSAGPNKIIVVTASVTFAAIFALAAAVFTIVIFASPTAAFFIFENIGSYSGMVWADERAYLRAEKNLEKEGGIGTDYYNGIYLESLAKLIDTSDFVFGEYYKVDNFQKTKNTAETLYKYSDKYAELPSRAAFESARNAAALKATPSGIHPLISNYFSYVDGCRVYSGIYSGKLDFSCLNNDFLVNIAAGDFTALTNAYNAALSILFEKKPYPDSSICAAVNEVMAAYDAADTALAATDYASIDKAALLKYCEAARIMRLTALNSYNCVKELLGQERADWESYAQKWAGIYNDALTRYLTL